MPPKRYNLDYQNKHAAFFNYQICTETLLSLNNRINYKSENSSSRSNHTDIYIYMCCQQVKTAPKALMEHFEHALEDFC